MGIEDDNSSGGDDSIRASLVAAMESHSAAQSSTEAPVMETAEPSATEALLEAASTSTDTPAESTPSETAPSRVRDEKGRFAGRASTTPPPKAQTATASTGQPSLPLTSQGTSSVPPAGSGAASSQSATPTPQATPDAPKPPQAWSITAREKWSGLPSEIQAEVARREKETSVALLKSAESQKQWQAFQQVVGPYEGMIRAEGGEPLAAVGSLLQTAAALRTAPMPHKAQLVAGLVRQYGIPIEALDQALAGQSVSQGQSQGAPQEFRDSRLDTLLAEVEAAKHQRAQSEQRALHTELSTFAQKHEFFEDVKPIMSALLGGNIASSLEDAYAQAVKLHPEASAALQRREAVKQAENAKASTQQARNAASSVRSTPAGTNGMHKDPDTIRGALEMAIQAQSGR